MEYTQYIYNHFCNDIDRWFEVFRCGNIQQSISSIGRIPKASYYRYHGGGKPSTCLETSVYFAATFLALIHMQRLLSLWGTNNGHPDLAYELSEGSPFPVFTEAVDYGHQLSNMLAEADLLPFGNREKLMLAEGIQKALDFFYPKIEHFFGTSHHPVLVAARNNNNALATSVLRDFDRNMWDEIVKYTPPKASSLLQTENFNLSHYYENKFLQDLRKYFKTSRNVFCGKTPETRDIPTTEAILNLPGRYNHRIHDGNPAGNGTENIGFSCIFLCMVTIEHCLVNTLDEKGYLLFYSYTDWPFICSCAKSRIQTDNAAPNGENNTTQNLAEKIAYAAIRDLTIAGLSPLAEEKYFYKKTLSSCVEFFIPHIHQLIKGKTFHTIHETNCIDFKQKIGHKKKELLSLIDSTLNQLYSAI